MASPGLPLPVIGVDITFVSRVEALAARQPRFLTRIYTQRERADAAVRPVRLATRWAAKEAVRKLAVGLGWPRVPFYREIEVRRSRWGAPVAAVEGRDDHIALTLTDDGDLAIAVAVALRPPAPLEGGLAEPLPAGLVLPARPPDGHKGTFGTVVVLAGSHGLSGAAYLASMGAARGGAGLVRLCVPAALQPIMAVKCTEVMPHALPGDPQLLDRAGLEALRRDHLGAADALVVGPGMGRADPTREALAALLDDLPCPAVVDADALNLAAAAEIDWRRAGPPLVLTPHPAEMGRLARTSTAAIQADREGAATRYAAESGAVVVLKGSRTVVAAPDRRLWVDRHSVVALATGGTGDVLAGLCGAMLGAGLEAFDAAVAAVTIHAEAGAAVEGARGRAGALATDLLERLPAAQERVRRALEQSAARR